MEIQFTFIVELAKKYNQYNRNSQLLYQAINELPAANLQDIYTEYGDSQNNFQPVNLLRAEIARRRLAGEVIDEAVLEEIQEKIRAKDVNYFAHCDEKLLGQLAASKVTQRDIFANWQQPWRIFHTFFFRSKVKETVNLYQQQIATQLQLDLQLNDYAIHTVDFQGPNNFGAEWCWMALYPLAKYSHQDCYQFFVRFDAAAVAGRMAGSSLKGASNQQTPIKEDALTRVNSYAETLNVLCALKEDITQRNEAIRNYFKFAPGTQATRWESFYDQRIAALNFSEYDTGDLNSITSLRELNQKLGFADESSSNQTWNMWLFRNASVGDVLFATRGVNTIVGIGIVEGRYYYDESAVDYKHRLKVNWFANKVYQYTPGNIKGAKTLFRRDTFSPTKVWHAILSDYLRLYPEFKDAYDKFSLPYQQGLAVESVDTEDGDPIEEEFTAQYEAENYGANNGEANYWWLNANPNIWSISNHRDGHRQTYTTHNENGNKRRIYRHFKAVQPGDIVIGYESSPVKQIKALIEITKAIHQSETEGEVIEFEILKKFAVPIYWNELQHNPALRNCEVFINNQGSLFQLTEEEFDVIRDVIDSKNIPVEQQQSDEHQPYIYAEDRDKPFLADSTFREIVALLQRKKNIILQGPPGVGKTFVAKKLAYEIMGHCNDANIEMIQFHQAYSYEDFIQGLRPSRNGGFELKNGVFYSFCQKAHAHPNRQFFFIIDEINRGNLSKIFGELMLLMEADKRAAKWAIKLTYAEDEQDRFYIPENVHIIGTMNTADRSLAMVDYALRRRFAFINLTPDFGNRFSDELMAKGVTAKLVSHIQQKIEGVNQRIRNDDNLGTGFQIGHAYFCTYDQGLDELHWFHEVLAYEIKPLLAEIWFDDLDKVTQSMAELSW